MIKIMRGIIILAGFVLIFMVITACSTDSVFAKKTKSDAADENYKSNEKEDYYYDDGNNGSEDNNAKKNTGEYSKSDDSDYENYYQKGFASWYGREFHGRKTASGEKYDMNKFSAAHKELPFGTKINVRNLENNKEVTVVVNDRGPYKNSRILDLSYAAARKIGIVGSGEAKVGITIIKSRNKNNHNDSEGAGNEIEPVSGNSIERNAEKNSDDNSSGDIENNGDYSIQAGAFYSRKNAEKFQKRLESLVENPVVLINDKDLYKVKINKITSKKEAGRVKKLLENDNIHSYVIENK
jgi:rare lipoprotein A